jgi:asparagine synthase (glutamine-hydrolysing)
MCGIAGLFGSSPIGAGADVVLKEMLRFIRHRGPNEAGMYLSTRLCMGMVRLSIIGVASGQQPVYDDSDRYFLCYNGEVYNYLELRDELEALGYVFSSLSDTEVVLHAWQAWGPECLARFNGAFAFSLYDRRNEKLYLARDRYGKRPLYYARHGSNIIFASEMKSFLAVEEFSFELDPKQLASILTLWTPIADQSGFKGVLQVPHGCYATVSDSKIVIDRYHQPDFLTDCVVSSERDAVERIQHTLRHAVELRLRSDVEVGMYLSGGLDSSILASILAEKVRGFRTYSVGFEDAEFDETLDQNRMVSLVQSKHQALRISDKDIADHFPAAVFHAEVPVFRTALVPMYLLSRAVRDDGIKVVLTGEGADEAFLGYDLFKETILRSEWNAISDAEKVERLRRLYPYLKHYEEASAADLLGLYQQFSQEQYPGLFSHELRIQNGLFSRRLIRHEGGNFDEIDKLIAEHGYFSKLSATEKAQWLEYQSLLPGYLLSSQGDRMTMAHSIENRCPFLDPQIATLSAAVNLKFDDGSNEKYLLRRSFENQLPELTTKKGKHPYRAPDSKAFVSCRPDYLDLLLSNGELEKNPILNPAFCKRLTDKIFRSPPDQISTKENQTFVFLLSIALQHHRFVERNLSDLPNNAPVDDIMIRVVDRRQDRGF